MPILTRRDISAALTAAGLTAGDKILLHSSLSSMGRVEGGADAVIDAFLDVLGPEGTLMVPTFGGVRDAPWDAATAASHTGLITETLRLRPEAVRSLHPSHSVAAIGRDARGFSDGHLDVEAVGIGSPIDKITQAGGWVLLLGVTHVANTTIHIAESRAKAPYLPVPRVPPMPVLLPDRTVFMKGTVESPGCSLGFDVVDEPLRERGVVSVFRIGDAECRLMRAIELIDAIIEIVRAHPHALFCHRPECPRCMPRRALLRQLNP